MSTCGGICACGSCGNACTCGTFPDIEKSTTVTIIEGVAPVEMNTEKASGTEGGHACKCGPNCSCNPCNC